MAGMVSPLLSDVGDLTGGSTNWTSLAGSLNDWNGNETRQQMVVPCAMTIDYLRVQCVAPGVGQSRTFMVRKTSANTTLTAAVTDANTKAQDTTHSVSLVAGDLVDMQQVSSATAAASANTTWVIRMTCANANEQALMWRQSVGAAAGATRYAPLQGNGTIAAAAAAGLNVDFGQACIISAAGALDSMYVHLDANMTGGSQIFTLMLNGATTALTVTIASGAAIGNDTTHTVNVVKGDYVSWQLDNTAGTNGPRPCISCRFKPTTNGESLQMSSMTSTQAASQTRYANMAGGGASTTATETSRQALMIACSMYNLYFTNVCLITGSVAVMVRQNTADTTLQVAALTGAGATTPATGNDTTHTVTVVDDDVVNLRYITSTLTGTVLEGASFVTYIAPATTSTLIGASNSFLPAIAIGVQ